MTEDKHVSLTTKKGFLVDRFKEADIEIEFLPNNEISREQIIDRAKTFQFAKYNLLDLNCKIFVESIILDIKPPQRTLEVKKFQMFLCDMAISMLKLQLTEPSNEKYFDYLAKRILESENDKKRLATSITELNNRQTGTDNN
jgi:hypothetical protein